MKSIASEPTCASGAVEGQGHSKKPAGDDGNHLGAILAEVLSGLRHGHATGTNEGSRADAASILIECHIAHIVKPVLDGPMGARQVKQAFGTGLGGGQAGDDVDGLSADFSAEFAGAFDARNLSGAGPVKMGDDFGADRDFANLDAAMLLVNRLRRLQIGRRKGMPRRGKGRRSFRRWRLSAGADCLSPQISNRLSHLRWLGRFHAGKTWRRR